MLAAVELVASAGKEAAAAIATRSALAAAFGCEPSHRERLHDELAAARAAAARETAAAAREAPAAAVAGGGGGAECMERDGGRPPRGESCDDQEGEGGRGEDGSGYWEEGGSEPDGGGVGAGGLGDYDQGDLTEDADAGATSGADDKDAE